MALLVLFLLSLHLQIVSQCVLSVCVCVFCARLRSNESNGAVSSNL